MGLYSQTTVSDGTAITASYFNTEFGKVATAENTLTTDNFGGGASVANSELVGGNLFTLCLCENNIPFNEVMTTPQVAVSIPRDCTLIKAKAAAANVTDGTESIDIYLEDGSPATIMGSALTITSSVTSCSFTLSTTSFSENDVLSLRAETDAGTEAIKGLVVTLLFKATTA